MKKIALSICLFLGLISVAASYAAELTENTVTQVLARVDNAVSDLDARAIAREMSDDVSITMNISYQGQKQVMRPSKQQYISMLEQGWAQYENYEYSRSNVTINVVGNKAFISADVQESMIIQGQSVSGSSQEKVTIELINGRPLVTQVVAYVSM